MKKTDLILYLWWMYLRYMPARNKSRTLNKDNLPRWQKPETSKSEAFQH
jgi:hypothetical protein